MTTSTATAVDAQIERIDAVEAWARDIDAGWWHHWHSAVAAQRHVEKAWGDLAPCEDDPAWLIACYARSLFEAVAAAADTIASSCVSDPRDRRRNGGWDSVLNAPEPLTA